MSKENALYPEVKDAIAFDALWQQACEKVTALSGDIWTDTGDHDPGVTVLQATTWNCADLGYRASLPLNDLLTQKNQKTLFPEEFGPDHVLTCNTITAEDYRRAILDLRCNPTDAPPFFLFSEALLVQEPESDRFCWFYNNVTRRYSFSEAADDTVKMSLRGNNWLYVIPTRETLTHKGEQFDTMIKPLLDTFLEEHRNLGEKVTKVIRLEPADFTPRLTVELADDGRDVNQIFAHIYQIISKLVLPTVRRYTTEEMRLAGYDNEGIFDGPLLKYGWQRDTAQRISPDGMTINLSDLVNQVLAIEGVHTLRDFQIEEPAGSQFQSVGKWLWQENNKKAPSFFPLLWGEDPLTTLIPAAGDKGPLRLIDKRGVTVPIDRAKVEKYLIAQSVLPPTPVTLPAGKLRNTAYTPVGQRLPECYKQQVPATTIEEGVRQLHQFLLPVDQLLADVCAELAHVPKLLAFKERSNAIRGTRWPYPSDTISYQVHKDYEKILTTVQQQDAEILTTDGHVLNEANFARELDYLQFLLGYFGADRAARALTLDPVDFLHSQRAYLAQQPSLGYDRINIRTDKISSLQKRLAASIGLGSECLLADPPLDALSFYLIEHRQLLPQRPSVPHGLTVVKDFRSDGGEVTVTSQSNSDCAGLRPGILVNLQGVVGNEAITVGQQLIKKTTGHGFVLDIENSSRLRNNLKRLEQCCDAKTLKWEISDTWLQDMVYRLHYADSQTFDGEDKPDIGTSLHLAADDQSPFPVMVNKGDVIIIERSPEVPLMPEVPQVSELSVNNKAINATIDKVNMMGGTLELKITTEQAKRLPKKGDAWRWRWKFADSVYATQDRFSFIISVVHNRALFKKSNMGAEKLVRWVERTIAPEFPAHVSLINHWMGESAFKNFAETYARWQGNGTRLGDDSYALMEMLGLGRIPESELAIGLMRIATPAERADVMGPEENETQWNTKVIGKYELFYTPKDE